MGWSAWQPPWLAPADIASNGKYFYYRHENEIDASLSAPIAPMVATAKASINSGGGSLGIGSGTSELLAFTNAARDQNTQVQLELGYSAVRFDAAAAEGFTPDGAPPALSGLTYGTDYTDIPAPDQGPNTDSSGLVDYETSGQTFSQWDVFHGSYFLHLAGGASAGGSLPSTITIPLRFWCSTALAAHTGNATLGPALGYAPSNVIGDLDMSCAFATTPSGNFTQSFTDMDISAQPEAFTLVAQTRWQGAETVLSNEITSGFGSYQLFVTTKGTGGIGLSRALYTTPRWRYWIPATTAGWHTVGGHWSTVGGAELRRLTPTGSGPEWLPVLDGPA